MKVITGHLTVTNKNHINFILKANMLSAKVNTITYILSLENDIYTVYIFQKDNNIIYGDKISKYKATFKV